VIWYYSSVKTWAQHMVKKRGLKPAAPMPEDIVSFPHAFPSFGDFYSRKGRITKLPVMASRSVVLDSGAHHFFNLSGHSVAPGNSGVTGGNVAEYDLNHYVQSYIAFVKHNWDKIDYFIELDIADIYGMKHVKAVRNEFVEADIWEKCVGGWHPVNGMDDYEDMLTWPSGMVGLQGMRRDAAVLPYNKLIKMAYDVGVKAHGFAMTKPEYLLKWPFYSVDSTSWLSPDRYGQIRIFDMKTNSFQTIYSGKATRFKNSPRRIKPVVMFDLYDQLAFAIKETEKAQTWFTNYWRSKGVLWRERVMEYGRIYDDDRTRHLGHHRPDRTAEKSTVEL